MRLRNTFIIVVALLMGVTTGCNKEELENLRQENQQLNQTLEEKNATIEELKQKNNRINQILQQLVEKQDGADSAAIAQISGNQVKQRLNRLNKLVRTSGEKADALRYELRGARSQASNYKQQVNELEKEIKTHEDSIRQINKDVMDKMQQIEKMTATMEEKDTTIAKLKEENKEYLELLRKKNQMLNTGYVAVGDEKNLEEDGVIVKKGGFLGFLGQTAVLHPDFDQSHFREFDKTNEREIKIDAKKKKVEVVTPQPENAYTLEQGEGDQTVLKITDADMFWRATKYLVVSY